ncbi:MAG: hypothetical protein ACPLKZ_02420 [Candidatus Bathyarchaeales archaeon]
MYTSIGELESIIETLAATGNLPTETLHRITLASFIKAGISLYGSQKETEKDIHALLQSIPAAYRGLANGKLYLNCLNYVKSFNNFLQKPDHSILLKEANIQYMLDFLKSSVGKVGGIIVLDCGSIPELITFAGKLTALNHNATIYDKAFINPTGVTAFVTGQMGSLGREAYLREYAKQLKDTLSAKFFIKSSTIDLTAHQQGITIENFLQSLQIQKIFDQIHRFARQDHILITSDHGYDVIADEHGLYITHGYKEKCPLNFSKIALFLVID